MDENKKSKNLLSEAAAEAALLGMLFGGKPACHKPAESRTPAVHTEAVIDFDHVSIPTSRFEELVRAEEQLDIVLRSYHQLQSYRLDEVLAIILGPRPVEGGDGAQ